MSNSAAEAWASCRGSSWAAAATAKTARADSSCCYRAKCRFNSRGAKILFFSFFLLPAPASFYSQIRLLEHTKTGRGESDSDGRRRSFVFSLPRSSASQGRSCIQPLSPALLWHFKSTGSILSEDLICPPGNSTTSDYMYCLAKTGFLIPRTPICPDFLNKTFSLVCVLFCPFREKHAFLPLVLLFLLLPPPQLELKRDCFCKGSSRVGRREAGLSSDSSSSSFSHCPLSSVLLLFFAN